MVKFEIRDDALMVLNALPSLAKGAYALATPRHYEEWEYGTLTSTVAHREDMTRCNGLHLAALGALQLAARNNLTAEGHKVWFRTTGVLKGATAAYAATQTYRGKKRNASGYTDAAVIGTLAALNLWRGFKRENTKITL